MTEKDDLRNLRSSIAIQLNSAEEAIDEMQALGESDYYGVVALRWLIPQVKKAQARARKGDVTVLQDANAQGAIAALETAIMSTMEELDILDEEAEIVEKLGLKPM